MPDYSYVLITAAKNEETHIRRILQSVVNQTRLPRIWVIVSDGSTDRTDDFVLDFARRHEFIRLMRLGNDRARAFSSQAFASNAGYDSVKHTEFAFVGFLDADISFDAGYYESLLKLFAVKPHLGVAGGEIFEQRSGRFQARIGNSENCVPGAVQLFRRQCFEEIGGGFVPLQYGGQDFVACAMARKKGWEARPFPGLPAFHHRPTGSAGTTVGRARFYQGMGDYFMGYQPLYAIGKCVRRVKDRPRCLGSILQLLGYVFPWLTRQKRTVPDEFVRYLRQEQLRRMLPAVLRHEESTEGYRKSA